MLQCVALQWPVVVAQYGVQSLLWQGGFAVALWCCRCTWGCLRLSTNLQLLFIVQVGDLNMCLRSLDVSLDLSKQIGETSRDSDVLGEIADVYTEMGDLENAGKVSNHYHVCYTLFVTAPFLGFQFCSFLLGATN